jgi:GTPase SAR1 family protein
MFLQVFTGAHEVHTLLPSSIMDPSTLREKFKRFRILIIGRANAGKTTILQRVCKTRENPEIYNSAGEKVRNTITVVLG